MGYGDAISTSAISKYEYVSPLGGMTPGEFFSQRIEEQQKMLREFEEEVEVIRDTKMY